MGIKKNNVVDNLEWVTYSENMKHAIDNNLFNPNLQKINEEELNNLINYYLSNDEVNLLNIAKKLKYKSKDSLVKVMKNRINDKNKLDFFMEKIYNEGIINKKISSKIRGRKIYGISIDNPNITTRVFNSISEAANFVNATASMVKSSADKNSKSIKIGNKKRYFCKNYYWYYL